MKRILLISSMLITWLSILSWCTLWNTTSNKIERTCKDVTSYDHNRDNDMRCTSTNWETRYTSYEWARLLESL